MIVIMTSLDPIATLRRVPFFAVLGDDELRRLAGHCIVRLLQKDELLSAEGDGPHVADGADLDFAASS